MYGTLTYIPVLLHVLRSYVEAIATLRRDLDAAGRPSASLPLLQRAVVCAARCTGPLNRLSALFAASDVVNAAAGSDSDCGFRPSPGMDAAYDAATQQLLQAEQQHEVLLQHELAQYGASGCQAVQVANEAEGLLQVPASAARQLPPGHHLVGPGTERNIVLVHVPALQQSAQDVQLAGQQQAAAITQVMAAAAQLFLGSYKSFLALQTAVAELDILAGFAAATNAGAAPPGCSFCRPTFVAAAEVADSLNSSSWGGRVIAPVMHLKRLWHPLLAKSMGAGAVPNDVCLGGDDAGTMLLTGEQASVFSKSYT